MAAISVAAFHFSGPLSSEAAKFISTYTWLGVDVFFVISGFVIPLSLHGRGYRPSHFPTFMLRRLLRLEPPYLVSIAMVILLGYLSSLAPGFQGDTWSFSFPQIAAHLLYLVPFTEYAWLQPVYWSLAYEFAFYCCVGALFPFLIDRRIEWTVLVAAGIFGAVSLMKGVLDVGILHFVAGVLVMRFVVEEGDRISVGFWLAVSIALVFLVGGVPPGIAVAFAAAAILLGRKVVFGRWTYFLGGISYSLYLIHVPVGGRVINLGRRFGDGALYELALIACAMIVCVIFSVYFSRLVERPAMLLSRRVALS